MRYVFYSDLSEFLHVIEEKLDTKEDARWIGDNQVTDSIKFCLGDKLMTRIVATYGGCVSDPLSNALVYKEIVFLTFFLPTSQDYSGWKEDD